MAKGLSRNQLDELHAALAGQITPHHRFIAGATDGGLRYAEAKMEGMEEESKRRTFPSVIDVTHGSVRSRGSTG